MKRIDMKTMQALALACLALVSAPAMADKASEAAAERLFASMDMQSAMATVIDTTLDTQIAQKPELAPFKGVMHDFFAKYMSYEALKPQLIEAYAAEFTATELNEAADFYETPTGKKLLAKLPVLMAKGAEIGIAAVQGHVPELQAALQAEAKRLQALQEQAADGDGDSETEASDADDMPAN